MLADAGKLTMKFLGKDLNPPDGEGESPAWHAQILKEREERFISGKEVPLDWETTKELFRAEK